MQAKKYCQWGGALVLSLSLLSGCASREMAKMRHSGGAASAPDASLATSEVTDTSVTGVAKAAPMPASPTSNAAEGKKDADGTPTLASLKDAQPDRYLIKNATVSLETSDVRKVADQIIAFARLSHGYIF